MYVLDFVTLVKQKYAVEVKYKVLFLSLSMNFYQI